METGMFSLFYITNNLKAMGLNFLVREPAILRPSLNQTCNLDKAKNNILMANNLALMNVKCLVMSIA